MTSPLIHSTPATDPNLLAAPFLTFGTSAALSGEISVDATALGTFPDRNMTFQWNSGNNRQVRFDNIGAGALSLGVNGAPSTSDVLTATIAAFGNVLGIRGTRTLTANASTINQLLAFVVAQLAGFNLTTLRGLAFQGQIDDSVGTGLVTNFNIIETAPVINAAVTNVRYNRIVAPSGLGVPVNVYGFDIGNLSALSGGVTYGYNQADLATGPIARHFEYGSVPYARLLASGEWAPAAEQTPLYLAEGVAPTLRNVQWVDPGLGGINLVAGQRVMILV